MYKKLLVGFDIKWSVLNILVEAWLVSIIRLLIPRYSKIYYSLDDYSPWYIPVSIIHLKKIFKAIILFVLHMIYDETLTYWAHR